MQLYREGISRRDVIVVVLLGGLVALLIVTWVYKTRLMARRDLCAQRQHRISDAIFKHETQQNRFPGYRNLQAVDAAGKSHETGWVFPLLPTLKSESCWDTHGPLGLDETRGLPPQEYLVDLICPSDALEEEDFKAEKNWSSFVVNSGMPDGPGDWPENGVFFDLFALSQPPPEKQPAAERRAFVIPAEKNNQEYIRQHDGLAETLLLSENVDAGLWTDTKEALVAFVFVPDHPQAKQKYSTGVYAINENRGSDKGSWQAARPSSWHAVGVNAIFCDGHHQFVNENIDRQIWRELMAPDDQGIRLPGSDERLFADEDE